MASARSTAAIAVLTRSLGTLSPKNTTSGLSTPPQASHAGTAKSANATPSKSASPSGASAASSSANAGLRASSSA